MVENINSIPVIPFDRPDWIVRKPAYNRYKIVNYKPAFKTIGVPRGGKVIHATDKGTSLIINFLSYGVRKGSDGKADFTNRDSIAYSLKVKDGCLRIYKLKKENGVQSVTNSSAKIDKMQEKIFNFGTKTTIIKPAKNETPVVQPENDSEDMIFDFVLESAYQQPSEKHETRVIKSAPKRLNRVLIHFLKRHGVKFKFSKNPFENMRIACYPLSAGIPLKKQNLCTTYSRYLLRGDFKGVVKNCFGYDNRKLIQMVCENIKRENNLNCLILGQTLKGLVHVDYFYKLLETKSSIGAIIDTSYSLKLPQVRKLFKNYNSARLLKLTSEDVGNTSYNFFDSIRMFNELGSLANTLPEKPKNWHDIHEHLTEIMRRQVRDANQFELPVRKKFKEIDGALVDDLKLEVPKHTVDLQKYGGIMHNCIAGYGRSVKNGDCNLLAVYRGDELLYNIAINGNKLNQFLGKRNSAPPETDRLKVVEFLANKGILSKNYINGLEFEREYPTQFVAAAPRVAVLVDDDELI